MRWIKAILDWIGRGQILQAIWLFVKPLLLPVLVIAATGAAGWLGHIPLMWIIMASALTFMAAMVGVFFVAQLRRQNTTKHKILYQGTQVNADLTPLVRKARKALATGAPQARTLDKAQIGVVLHNSAHFPISVQLVKAETEMEGETPPRSMFPKQPTTILPGNSVWVMDDPIDMKGHPCEKLEGHMDLRIRYGRPGKEREELHFAGRVEALMGQDGFMHGTYTHWDSELQNLPTSAT